MVTLVSTGEVETKALLDMMSSILVKVKAEALVETTVITLA